MNNTGLSRKQLCRTNLRVLGDAEVNTSNKHALADENKPPAAQAEGAGRAREGFPSLFIWHLKSESGVLCPALALQDTECAQWRVTVMGRDTGTWQEDAEMTETLLGGAQQQ